MADWLQIAAAAGAWLAWASLVAVAARLSPRPDEPRAGFLLLAARVYARIVHRLRVEGREHVPASVDPGPLIVVVNHTAGVDPVLVQAACPFEIRWVMAEDMRVPRFESLWRFTRVIFVDRRAKRGPGLRDAIRHVRAGGVIGVFPEGRIERPPRRLLPFEAGVGFLIRRTKARVLPVLVEGTPEARTAWASLLKPSRAVVRFDAPIDYTSDDREAETIAADLRARFSAWSGWPQVGGPMDEREQGASAR